MTYNAPFTFPATKGIFLSFSPLSKATWHSRGDFWGRRELVSALHRNCLREIKDCIKNKNTLVVFGVCVFFSSVVTVADKWRFVSSSFCSCEKRSVPTYGVHRDAFYGKCTAIGNFVTKWTLHWPGLLSPAQVDVHIVPSVVFLLR